MNGRWFGFVAMLLWFHGLMEGHEIDFILYGIEAYAAAIYGRSYLWFYEIMVEIFMVRKIMVEIFIGLTENHGGGILTCFV